jgi:4-amino-4-deoxy-L-arabinose transferase-like glycosyltransferase
MSGNRVVEKTNRGPNPPAPLPCPKGPLGVREGGEETALPISMAGLIYAVLGIIGVVGIGVIIYSTTLGPGIGGDATLYIEAARNLLAGKGLVIFDPAVGFKPLPYSAPLFPILLAGIGLTGADQAEAARWLNALLFGGTIFLVGAFVLRFTRSAAVAVLSALLVLLSPVAVRTFSWAMAEPVFLFTGFLGIFLILLYTEKPRAGLLIGAILAAGCSVFARYIGASFVGAGVLILLLLDRRRWVQRVTDSVLLLGSSMLPITLWIVWDFLQTHTVASRSVLAGPGLGARILSALPSFKEAFLFWIIPDSWVDTPPYPQALNTLALLGAAVALILLAAAVIWRTRVRKAAAPPGGSARLALGLAILVAVYLAVTLVVYVSTYPPITLDNRMIVPVHLAVLVLVAVLAGMLLQLEGARRWLQVGLWIVLLGFAATYVYRTPRIVLETHRTGLGYLAEASQYAETIAAVKALTPETPIITNEVTRVMYYTGRPAYALFSGELAKPGSSPFTYGSDPTDPGQAAFHNGAALVIFNTFDQTLNDLYGTEGPTRLATLTQGLYQAKKTADGTIYYYEKP